VITFNRKKKKKSAFLCHHRSKFKLKRKTEEKKMFSEGKYNIMTLR
jgi:hypothetical protein